MATAAAPAPAVAPRPTWRARLAAALPLRAPEPDPLRPEPALPWLPWIAFGVLLGCLAPGALGDGAACWAWWALGLPLAALGLLAPGPAWPWARRWVLLAASATLGMALAWHPARATPDVAPLAVEGEVVGVLRGGWEQRIVLRPDAGSACGERLRVEAPPLPALAVGDRVRVAGLWRIGHYGEELAATRLEHLVLRDHAPRGPAWRALERVDREPLASALLIGIGSPPERVLFRDAGLQHVLAVSGMHLVIAAGLAVWLLRALGVPWLPRLLAVTALIAGYTWLTGAAPATLRAAVMAFALAGAALVGRETHRLAAPALAIVVLLAWDPGLAHDRGFQLSMAAILGILTLGRELIAWRAQRWPLTAWPLDRAPWRLLLFTTRSACDGLAVGLAAALATAPLVALHFHTANPWSPLSSLVAALPATAALWLGLPTLAGAGLWPDGPWEGLYAGLGWSLDALVAAVGAAARLPGATVQVIAPAVATMLAWPFVFWPTATRRGALVRTGLLATALMAWLLAR